VNLLDAVFFAALSIVTSGYDSSLYWVFLFLIIRNAMSISATTPQIALNLMVSLFYLSAGIVDLSIRSEERRSLSETFKQLPPGRTVSRHGLELRSRPPEPGESSDLELSEGGAEPLLLRMTVLWLMAGWCYGVPVLWMKQRQA